MKKFLTTLSTFSLFIVSIIFLFSFFTEKALSQSPIKCGYLDEPCCDFAGSTLSCDTGLVCLNGSCVSDGTIENPPTRTEVLNESNYTPGEGIAPSTNNKNQNILCDGSTGISTAIGCIHALGDENAFLNDLLKWAVGIGSGIAFVLMLVAGFMIMTAQGNPERLKAGQELLTSAIAGLILLIFSVFILKFIGIDILGLGKFGFGK